MYLYTRDPYIYGIISLTYNPEKSIRQQRQEAITKFTKNICDFLGLNWFIPEENVLVLWNGLPEDMQYRKTFGHSTEWLLYMFCQRILADKNAHGIFIDSPTTLADGNNSDLATLLKHMVIIYNTTNIIPTYLHDNFLENIVYKELPSEVQEIYNSLVPKDSPLKEIKQLSMEMEVTNQFTQLLYEKIFLSLKNLLSIQGYTFAKDGTKIFIHQYFMYQSGISKIKECAKALELVSVPSFYRYNTEFENSPLYIEYLVAYDHIIKGTAKLGTVPDPILFIYEYNKISKFLTSEENPLSVFAPLLNEFKEIAHILEIPRIKLACDKKIQVMKRKGLYKQALAERGLNEMDLK